MSLLFKLGKRLITPSSQAAAATSSATLIALLYCPALHCSTIAAFRLLLPVSLRRPSLSTEHSLIHSFKLGSRKTTVSATTGSGSASAATTSTTCKLLTIWSLRIPCTAPIICCASSLTSSEGTTPSKKASLPFTVKNSASKPSMPALTSAASPLLCKRL